MVHLNNLGSFIDNYDDDFLVIGQSPNIGLSDFFCEYISDSTFFFDNLNIFYVTNDIINQQKREKFIKDYFLKEYSFNVFFENNKFKVGSSDLYVIDISKKEEIKYEVKKPDKPINLIIVDFNLNVEMYDKLLLFFETIAETLIISTYDYEESSYYYVEDKNRIIVYSDRKKHNIEDFYNNDNYVQIAKETKELGKFNGEDKSKRDN